MPKIERKTRVIDARDQVLGRLATRIAILLMGKDKPGYVPYHDQGDAVLVANVDKMKITGKKLEQKKYYRHSGRPGQLKERSLGEVMAKNPSKVLWHAVYNMLPKNKLRKGRMKRLQFKK